eukprot:TRINITY_DN31923_c0_g1_i1.p1 TRINITY_DN31923_c0_g1~~TRINITY_DN31923_c0_g1_i1.p1  ORF type:complete len:430 (-),score=63.03 TRINITY_DN31923_c0_g1_i1:64-1353(-)
MVAMRPIRGVLIILFVWLSQIEDGYADGETSLNDGKEAHACTLASLVLHSQGRPIDLEPSFKSHVLHYSAILDWSMSSFSVNVRPDTGCEDSGVPRKPVEVQIGGSAQILIYAEHPATGAKQAYKISVNRLLGSETELQHLSVIGGEMNPFFDPEVRSYAVRLDLENDIARVMYRLADNEQRIRCSAQRESPARAKEASRRLSYSSFDSTVPNSDGDLRNLSAWPLLQERRLGELQTEQSGEVQFQDAYADFMVDVGFTRKIELTVQCADATQASIETYTLVITRPNCPSNRPYFEPKSRRCVNFCPEGYYRNNNMQRCSRCNVNCQVCSGLLNCEMCLPNTADYSYVIQGDGKCKGIVNHIFKKYRWWCLGLGILLAFLVCIGCIGICQYCCSGPVSKSGGPRLYDSEDSDDNIAPPRFAAGRRLGMY